MTSRYTLPATLLLLILVSLPLSAQTYSQEVGDADTLQRTTDSSLTQEWTSHYGYSISLPEEARFNKLQSKVDEAQQTEQANFMLRGGNGAVTLRYFTEQRMLPLGYKKLDSIHFYETDSVGVNGTIYRRTYVLRDQAVEIQILLTERGAPLFADRVRAIFDSFVPQPGAESELHEWRYGRDPSEYEEGRYPKGGGPSR